jgi:hypothetical protein
MQNQAHGHLDSNQLLKAVVSEADLPRPLRDHLDQCPACRQEVDRLAARFNAIGKMARDTSPDALGRVRLPEDRRRFFLGRRIGLRPALGMAVAMVLLMMLVLYQPFGERPSLLPRIPAVKQTAEPTLTPEAEAQLFAEIQALLRNPLPEDYQQISGGVEGGGFGVWDDPTDLIVPDLDEDADAQERFSYTAPGKDSPDGRQYPID